jgi:hypothetical protein
MKSGFSRKTSVVQEQRSPESQIGPNLVGYRRPDTEDSVGDAKSFFLLPVNTIHYGYGRKPLLFVRRGI